MPNNLPKMLAIELRDRWGLPNFIETGTYKAETTRWAADNFSRVISIENWEPYYLRCVDRCEHYDNIELLFGDSRLMLVEALERIAKPALIWLDAHYGGTPDRGRDCPLLAELATIRKDGRGHVILIDDMHSFQGGIEGYPTMAEICMALSGYRLSVTGDILLAEPEAQ